MKHGSKGFTLIEIAVVLVVIGLLLGGILKGQELINNTKVKGFATDFLNVPILLHAYEDKFRALPGDDARVASHLPGATVASTPAGMLGNNIINGAWDTTVNTDETCLFWQHVRLAGLATGTTIVDCAANSDHWPKNANGGQIGIQSNTGFTTMTTTFTGTYIVCSKNVLGKFVLQIDTLLDDGDPATGSMRAILQTAVPGAPASKATVQANAEDSFVVCMGV